MSKNSPALESDRLALQSALDAEKTQAERNRMGQFATPTALAEEVLRHAIGLLPAREKISFLDPAIGTGSFYSALLKTALKTRVAKATGFEIDPHYGKPAAKLWKECGLETKLADFTKAKPDARFNLVICNPPYVRHHHMQNEEKARLQLRTLEASGMKLSGLAGLYCHFLGLTHGWMSDDGIAVWLIPSEFMDVNYGLAVKKYLLERVTLLHIHRFDPNDVQFADALVSSAVVCFKNAPPPKGYEVTFTFGGTLGAPHTARRVSAQALREEPKWTRFPASDVRQRGGLPVLSDFFKIKRGIATGDNGYFILSEEYIEKRGLPLDAFTPILPSPRYLQEDEVKARRDGTPDIVRRLFLLDTKLSEAEIAKRSPALAVYLEEGKAQGLHERYLCKHRALWYGQENRPPAPIVCTYLGRGNAKSGRPFRFIRNDSRATVANVYLAMYPTPLLGRALSREPQLMRRIWSALNALTPDQLLGEGRVYGGGLHKLEPRELANVPVPSLAALLPDAERPTKQADLLTELVA
jgi:hypothetical protein